MCISMWVCVCVTPLLLDEARGDRSDSIHLFFFFFISLISNWIDVGRWRGGLEERTQFWSGSSKKEGICIIFYFNSLLCSIPIGKEGKKMETFSTMGSSFFLFLPLLWKTTCTHKMMTMMMKSIGLRALSSFSLAPFKSMMPRWKRNK